MPTKPDITGHFARDLSVAKSNAIDLLVTGATDQVVAAVGVTRQTVNGWRNHDPAFIAALNARRLDLWGGAADKLRALLPTALDTLEAALTEKREWRAAVAVIELAGLDRQERGVPNLGPSSIGPADPEAIVDAMVRDRRRDPLEGLLAGGDVTAAERREVLTELAAKRAAAELPAGSGG